MQWLGYCWQRLVEVYEASKPANFTQKTMREGYVVNEPPTAAQRLWLEHFGSLHRLRRALEDRGACVTEVCLVIGTFDRLQFQPSMSAEVVLYHLGRSSDEIPHGEFTRHLFPVRGWDDAQQVEAYFATPEMVEFIRRVTHCRVNYKKAVEMVVSKPTPVPMETRVSITFQRSHLHCYRNETDTFIATSAEHAKELFVAHYKAMGAETDADGWEAGTEFEQIPDDKVLEIRSDYDGKTHSRTAREWINDSPPWLELKDGAGFLCTTEF